MVKVRSGGMWPPTPTQSGRRWESCGCADKLCEIFAFAETLAARDCIPDGSAAGYPWINRSIPDGHDNHSRRIGFETPFSACMWLKTAEDGTSGPVILSCATSVLWEYGMYYPTAECSQGLRRVIVSGAAPCCRGWLHVKLASGGSN